MNAYPSLLCIFAFKCKEGVMHAQVNYNTDDGGIEVDPDARDADTTNQKGVEETKKFITQYLLGISTAPSIVEPCILTVSGSYWEDKGGMIHGRIRVSQKKPIYFDNEDTALFV